MRLSPTLVALVLSLLALHGCGPGGGASGTYNPGTSGATSSAVTLSGTIIHADVDRAIATPQSNPDGSAVAGMWVTAVDQYGNSRTTSGDNSGHFSFTGLKGGLRYSLIFIDRRTLQVVGSLVARATGTTGALDLRADTDLKEVLLDPNTGRAVSNAELLGALRLVDGAEFDADQDGKFDRDDTTSLQASTLLSQQSAELTTLSLADYLGEPGVWWMGYNRYSHDSDNYCTWLERQLHVVRSREVTGPDGRTVQALKRGYVHYFDGEIGSQCYLPVGGYYDETYASDIDVTWGYPESNATLSAPPSTYSVDGGLWGGADFIYVDQAKGLIYMGNRDRGELLWGDAADEAVLPLNPVIGKDNLILSYAWNGLTFAVTLRVEPVRNEDGSAAVVTDARGTQLPVIKLVVTYSEREDDDPTWGYSESDSRYYLAKYGVEAHTDQRWDLTFAHTRFGLLQTDGSIVDTTPTQIGSVTLDPAANPFPDRPLDGVGAGISTLRDQWVRFVDANLSNLDAYQVSNQSLTSASDYIWVEGDIDLASWDSGSYEDWYWFAESLARNDGNDWSGLGRSLQARYHGTATAHLEWRVWSDAEGQMYIIDRTAPLQMEFDDPACDATLDECLVTLTTASDFAFPPYADVTTHATPWMAAVPVADQGYRALEVAQVSLVLVLLDGNGDEVDETVVHWYYITP